LAAFTGTFSQLPLRWEGVGPNKILLLFSGFETSVNGLQQGL
jgi:hypothetical protein